MKEQKSYLAGDYAGIDAVDASGRKWKFYYGYEETVGDGEWAFVVKCDGVELMRKGYTDILPDSQFEPQEVFMEGMAHWIGTVTP